MMTAMMMMMVAVESIGDSSEDFLVKSLAIKRRVYGGFKV